MMKPHILELTYRLIDKNHIPHFSRTKQKPSAKTGRFYKILLCQEMTSVLCTLNE